MRAVRRTGAFSRSKGQLKRPAFLAHGAFAPAVKMLRFKASLGRGGATPPFTFLPCLKIQSRCCRGGDSRVCFLTTETPVKEIYIYIYKMLCVSKKAVVKRLNAKIAS